MPDPAPRQAGKGPVTVLLLLFGLILGSAPAAASRADTGSPLSGLTQTRATKNVATLRQAPCDAAAKDADKLDGPPLLPAPAQIVSRPELRPGSAAPAAASASPTRPLLLAYQARAPPAA